MEDIICQLEELEALQAMYPEEEGCFVLAPAEREALQAAATAVASAKAESGNAAHLLLSNLSGTVRLPGLLLEGHPVALRFQLPPGYPTAEPPQLSVECSAPRPIHEQISAAVRAVAEAAVGSESLLLVLGVLQEAVEDVAAAHNIQQPHHIKAGLSTTEHSIPITAAVEGANSTCDDDKGASLQPQQSAAAAPAVLQQILPQASSRCSSDLLRVVVWFHHIKNSEKRKNLVSWARELDCSGFSKPGFPGVVIVEGLVVDVREYVSRVRALQWQAMQVRGEQLVSCSACRSNDSRTCTTQYQNQVQQDRCGQGALLVPNRAFHGKFLELPETGMSQLGQECRAAGLEELFLSALKITK